MPRGPFLVPSILWLREWGALPWPGSSGDAVAAEADRLILALNLAGYEVVELALGVGTDASTTAFSLDLEARAAGDFGSWEAYTGTSWPSSAAALGLRVKPRNLLEDAVAVFALGLPLLAGAAAQVTFDSENEGWLVIALPGSIDSTEDALDVIADAHEPAREAIIEELAALWAAGLPARPEQPSPTPWGLLFLYDPSQWRFPSRAGAEPWEALIGAASEVWDKANENPRELLEETLLGSEKTLLDRLDDYGVNNGETGTVLAEQLLELAGTVYCSARGLLGTGERSLFQDLPHLPYTVALLVLQDLFLVDFLGTIDTFTPIAEGTEVDLTGFYERSDPGGQDTLQLNQAGIQLEGSWQEHEDLFETSRLRSFVPYSFGATGDAASPTAFALRRSGDQIIGWHLVLTDVGLGLEPYGTSTWEEGSLTVDTSGDQPELTVTIGADTRTFRRVSNKPHLSEETLTGVPEDWLDLTLAMERYPLHSTEAAQLLTLATSLADALAVYYAIDATNTDAQAGPVRWDGANDLDDAFMAALLVSHPAASAAFVPNHVVGAYGEQTAAARLTLIGMLTSMPVVATAPPANAWVGLTEPMQTFGSRTPHLRAFFGFAPMARDEASTAAHHVYEWQMFGFGLSADIIGGLGFFPLAGMKMRKLSGEPAWSKTQEYGMALVGGSFGVSMGGTFFFETTWTTLTTDVPWSPEDFVGTVEIVQVVVQWVGSIGASYGASVTVFGGAGTWLPAASTSIGHTLLGGLGAGLEGGYQWGKLWLGGNNDASEVPAFTPTYTALTTDGAAGFVLFEVDGATLTEDARHTVRELCARHRAALSSPLTRLVIEGYASTTGTAEHNLTLSRARAASVYQTMRDFLGDALRIPSQQLEVRGLGEDPALSGGDEVERSEWRKVDVEIDGQLIMSLSGAQAI
jgi:outer membrane protein OmpA-like peptidoglycan-associated protein